MLVKIGVRFLAFCKKIDDEVPHIHSLGKVNKTILSEEYLVLG
jgi:hypothetical protein